MKYLIKGHENIIFKGNKFIKLNLIRKNIFGEKEANPWRNISLYFDLDYEKTNRIGNHIIFNMSVYFHGYVNLEKEWDTYSIKEQNKIKNVIESYLNNMKIKNYRSKFKQKKTCNLNLN